MAVDKRDTRIYPLSKALCPIDVVARVTSRRYGGLESLQLEIRDAALSGAHAEADAFLPDGRAIPAVAGT